MLERTDYWAEKRVVITGGSGFLGSALVDRLCTLGAELYPTSRAARPASGSVNWQVVDLIDVKSVENALTTLNPSVIFHLAGHVTGSRDLRSVLPTMHANLVSTVNLLTIASELGSRVVLSGSLEEPAHSESTDGASSPYSMAKWAATEYAALFERLYQTDSTVLRIGMAYGPGDQNRSRLIPYVIDSLLSGDRPLLTSGSRRIDWVYIDDVIDALVCAGQQASAGVGPFDVASGESLSIRRTVEMIVDILDSPVSPAFGALNDRPVDRDRVADLSATRSVIGWEPRVSLESGLRSTIDWHRRTR